ncbi:MAG: hypothetical protein NTV98_00015 [Candidatus Roizmanbacteria bacterium]|nr:hypothetical protein [Candidatus Roizmanbacteria bacterium]
MIYIHPRIRIGIVLILAFGISGVCMKYSQTTSETGAPSIEIKSLVADFSKQLTDSGAYVTSSLQAIRLPQIVSLSSSIAEVTPAPYEGVVPTPSDEWLTAPTSPPSPPTSTPAQAFPTQNMPSSVIIKPSLIPTIQPTAVPKPTKEPKPTPIPELPPVTSDQRPGSNLEEVFKEVSKRMCIPVALLKATQQEESGERYRSFANSKFSLANRYNWWNDASVTELDYFNGVAYYTQSGKGPTDSKFPGAKIAQAVQPDAYDQQIMGPEQISQQEQDVSRKNTIKILPKNIDRRVLFDNLIIYASITKNRLGKAPSSCDDWPEDAVKTVAEKHYGSCNIGGGRNYCTEVWNLYKSFK